MRVVRVNGDSWFPESKKQSASKLEVKSNRSENLFFLNNGQFHCMAVFQGRRKINRIAFKWKKGTLKILPLALTLLVSVTAIFAAKDVPTYHITAVQGDPVYLPCDISTNEEGDGMVIVLWYKGDSGTPIYSLDTRDRSLEQAERWSSDTAFSSRAYFITEKSVAELGIERIYESDAGVYRCRVDFKRAQTRNSKVNLTVIVPPQKIVILDESGIERTSVVGPYSEGSNLLLRCDVYGGNPKPLLTWLKNDQGVGEVVETLDEKIRAEILIENLGRKDLHSELTCQASNNNRTQPLSATVHIDMNFPPLDVRILGSTQSLSAGRRYDLLCQSSGSRPPASITWWKNGQRLENTKETTSNDGNITTSTLSFIASKDDAGKYLSCRSVNTVLSDEALEDGWKLQIQYIPESKIELGKNLNPETIREGTDVYFDCLIKSHPQIYKVEWRHNGRQLHHNIGQGIIISNQSLVLQGVSRLSAGNYTCVGFNTEGDGESIPFYLNVLYAPTCKPNQTRVHGVAKNEKANISCSVDANPIDVTFRWLFNNSAESIDVASSHISKSGTMSVVSYTPKTEMDYGTLLCWAKNSIGDQKVPCVFHIIAAGRPDPVHNCTKANMSMTSFSIKCGEGFNGGMPQSFSLEILESITQNLRVNLTSSLPKFNVMGLEPGVQYKALIYAFNQKGKSDPVVLPVLTLRLPEKQFTSEEEIPNFTIRLSPLMTIAALSGGALVLIISTVALILRFRRSRAGRRKNYKSSQEIAGSTGNKLDQSGCDSGDSDEKNPDVIPQPVSGCRNDLCWWSVYST